MFLCVVESMHLRDFGVICMYGCVSDSHPSRLAPKRSCGVLQVQDDT